MPEESKSSDPNPERKDYPALGSDLAKRKVKPFAPRSKVKKEQEFEPSPVVAVRNLPIDVTEKDLYELGMHFGIVVKILQLMQKSLAFIEFSNVNEAMNAVNTSQQQVVNIRQSRVYIYFSGRDHITQEEHTYEKTSKVLLVNISNIKYPITVQILLTVFGKYGEVQKIIIFQRTLGSQALVQMGNHE